MVTNVKLFGCKIRQQDQVIKQMQTSGFCYMNLHDLGKSDTVLGFTLGDTNFSSIIQNSCCTHHQSVLE